MRCGSFPNVDRADELLEEKMKKYRAYADIGVFDA
jgi:hypothetical protein